MSRLALYLLGPPRIELDEQPVHIGRRKAVALLTYLGVMRGNHSRDVLATLLWPDYDQSSARGRLRRTLSTLSRTIGGQWLAADRETVSLNFEGDIWLDVAAFLGDGWLQVGSHAIGMIDFHLYGGTCRDGTAIRFESFTVWDLGCRCLQADR